MTGELFDNPLGTDGFEFVEFTGPDPEKIARQFEAMGFVATARHRSKNVVRHQQGDINFILNMEPTGQAASLTRKAMALAEGPWAWRNSAAWPVGSMLRMKLMSPWR